MRTFLAIPLPENVRQVVYGFVQNEAKKDLPIKWVAYENLHITLRFLGEIDMDMKARVVQVVAGVCRKCSPFRAQLRGLGCFPGSRNPRVLWLGVDEGSQALCDLDGLLEKGFVPLGFKEEKRFHPHLTIGRIKKPCHVDDILKKELSTDPFDIHSVVLFR